MSTGELEKDPFQVNLWRDDQIITTERVRHSYAQCVAGTTDALHRY